ncbi:MAG: hypothetical protein O7B26_00350 [Planctomycetota bacterium]|nr:hypothetical protein [Planctomycetota bacterium]
MDRDLLHVTYSTDRIAVETMQETIRKEGFEASIRAESPEPAGLQGDP